jgi:hypothetical protein
MSYEWQESVSRMLGGEDGLSARLDEVERKLVRPRGPGEAHGLYMSLRGLNGFWPLLGGGGVGLAQEQGGRGQHLTAVGGSPSALVNDIVTYTAFNGSTQYLTRAHEAALNPTGALSVGGWFRFGSLSGTQGMIGKTRFTGMNERSYTVRASSTAVGFFVSSAGTSATDEGVTSSVTLATGTWYFVACRFTPGSELAIWVNDTKTTAAATISGVFSSTNTPFQIAARDNGAQLMTGDAALCWLCNVALTDGTIDRLFAATQGLFGV